MKMVHQANEIRRCARSKPKVADVLAVERSARKPAPGGSAHRTAFRYGIHINALPQSLFRQSCFHSGGNFSAQFLYYQDRKVYIFHLQVFHHKDNIFSFSSELLRFSVHNGLLLSITFLITIGLLCSLSPSMCRCRSATLSATMSPVCSNLSGTRLSHAHYLRSSSSLSDVPYRFQVHHVAAFHA